MFSKGYKQRSWNRFKNIVKEIKSPPDVLVVFLTASEV